MTPPMITNAWKPSSAVSPPANNCSNVLVAWIATRKPAAIRNKKMTRTAVAPTKPELFADGGEDHVGRRIGDLVGRASPESGTGETTVGQGERRFDDLEPGVLGIGEGIPPDLDPALHVIEHPVRDRRSGPEQEHAAEHVGDPIGGQVDHDDEQGEEQQRRTEVSLRDHHDQRHSPGQQQRTEVFESGRWSGPSRRFDMVRSSRMSTR